MDRIRAENLKTGHRVKLSTPLPNRPDEEYADISGVTEIDKGITSPIYRLDFKRSTFSLVCEGSREFEVETSQALRA